tara:strand:- start:13 stop:231 length:219 start_codon:yes stop_codon:yes gene_type:complete
MFELALNTQSKSEHISEGGRHANDHQAQCDKNSEMLLPVFEYGLRVEPANDAGDTDFQYRERQRSVQNVGNH